MTRIPPTVIEGAYEASRTINSTEATGISYTAAGKNQRLA